MAESQWQRSDGAFKMRKEGKKNSFTKEWTNACMSFHPDVFIDSFEKNFPHKMKWVSKK